MIKTNPTPPEVGEDALVEALIADLREDLKRIDYGGIHVGHDRHILRRHIERAVDELTRTADPLTTNAVELAAMREAGNELVAKLDECQPHIDNAFLMETMRGRPYSGPQYGEALEKLRAILSPPNVPGGRE